VAERRLIAKEDILLGGVLAYSRGQAVPEQVVADNDLQGSVAGDGTKEVAQIWADITGQPAESFGATTTTTGRAAAKSTTQEG